MGLGLRMRRGLGLGRLGRLARDQGGQVAVFFMLSFTVLFCLMAFLVDLGQVIHDKVLTQGVADAAAISGASVQAAGLNELADLNAELIKLRNDAQSNIQGKIFGMGGSQGYLQSAYYDLYMKMTQAHMLAYAASYASKAHQAAREVVDWANNRYQRGKSFQRLPFLAAVGVEPPAPSYSRNRFQMEALLGEPYPGTFLTVVGDWQPFRLSWLAPVCICPPHWCNCSPRTVKYFGASRRPWNSIEIFNRTIHGGAYQFWGPGAKDSKTTTYFRVRVWRDEAKPYLTLSSLGFDVAIPKVEAYALAQPLGGRISNGDASYRARLVPLNSTYLYDKWSTDPLRQRGRFRH